ncbi:MAG: glutathione S-transferase [Rhodospirillaceae bacterium]|nr:glutathione S-transferase [Rhodospirillaceae bacterium]
MKFYDCSTAPSPRRARVFIAEKGIDIETIQVDLGNREQLSDWFRKINPYCTVPVLSLDDGTTYTNTAGIRAYLDALYPEPNLMGHTAQAKGRIADLQWRIETEGMMARAEALRNSVPGMKGRALTGLEAYEQIPELAERGKARAARFLAGIEGLVGAKPFVAGDSYSVADIDLMVVVDFAGWLKMGLPDDAVNARRWHEAVSARASAKF